MMAKNIKGITIEISGDTSKLQKSLNAVNAPINKINKELKDLNQALKLDPKNTELLAQKQDVLKRNIEASTNKLNALKEAQKQMGSYSKLTDEQKAAYNRLSGEIAKSEDALKSMNGELKNMNKIDLTNLQNGLKKAGDIALQVSKVVATSVLAVSAAIGKVVADGVKSYAKLEAAQKGSQRLFGDSFKIVEKNAKQAYKTLGLSATEYYDQVNTYAVGLKNALNGDTEAAAKLSNSILIAQSDIVAATGADQSAVQNAFAAVMRGNYTMLDNLRLGIKGSKQGMQEVIDKVNEWNKANGNATKYQMGNYADMQQALVDYVKMQGIAGTAQKQMSETLTGSLSQMKAAFDNFINGSGSVKDLAQTITTFLKNVVKAIKKLAPDLVKGIVDLFNDLIPIISSMIGELLPIVIDGAKSLIQGLINFINNDSEQFIAMAVDVLNNLLKFILKNLPLLLQAGIKIITELAKGIGKAMPELIPAIVDAVILMCDTLIDNIDLLIDAAFVLIDGIIEGITRSLPKIIEAGLILTIKLAQGLIEAIPKLVEKLPEIITAICDGLERGLSDIGQVGEDLINGLWEGMYRTKTTLRVKVQNWAEDFIDDVKHFFGIHSPSKIMRDEVGKNLGLGVAEGINDTIGDVEKAMNNLASGVESSVNPTINPTANTNPLYITIDKFYNNRDTDIQQLAEELEFYRKNNALAKGGV